ncbi:hypothetical protein H8E88_08555 [candidate division KSB1 bacterium]|nr:hypothetical protein [candidate division KSB1 bacterium]
MIKITTILNVIAVFLFQAVSIFGQSTPASAESNNFISKFCNITESSSWELTGTIKLNFRTYHPQGMVKISKFYYLSSVEKITSPEKYKNLQNGHDRSTGKGIGHLFKFNEKGELISKISLGDSIIHHPGGIDFDGKFIWAPVAEYRPNSRSLVYRINPTTLECEPVFRFNDHIGAVSCDKKNNRLVGVSWGSRRFYFWELDYNSDFNSFNEKNENKIPNYKMKLNGNFYIDYQDCHYAGSNCILCGGLNDYSIIKGKGSFALGGLDLIDLTSFVPIHQIPITMCAQSGAVMTRNPFYFEIGKDQLRFYFIPEDNESNMYIYKILN